VSLCTFLEYEHTSAFGELDGWLYFASNEAGTSGVWRTNGSTTERMANQVEDYGLVPVNFSAVGSYLYFSADEFIPSGGSGSQNFRTNGTDIEKISTVASVAASVLTYGIDPVVELNGDVIFSGETIDGDVQLYKLHNATLSVLPTPGGGMVSSLLYPVGDWVYFVYYTTNTKNYVYRTNGSAVQKVSTNYVCPGGDVACSLQFLTVGNLLFFHQYSSSIGLELGSLDGTTPIAPANSAPPTITGTPQVNKTLTAGAGSWSGFPAPTYGYAWYRCSGAAGAGTSLPAGCTAISGATASTHKVVAADKTKGYLVVRVKATNSEGSVYKYSATVQIR
jgi:hypothetical protein